jgi:hypothetical protein
MRGLCHGKKNQSEPGLLPRQPMQYKKEIIRSSPAVDAFSQQALHSFQYASINHKRLFSASARVPSSTICSFQYRLSSTLVQSLLVKVPVSSTKKVSRHAFGFASLAFEPVTPMNSSAKAAPIEVQASAVKTKSNDALPFSGKSIKSFKYKSSSIFQLVVAPVSNKNSLSFSDKSRNLDFSRNLAFRCNELIELIVAFGRASSCLFGTMPRAYST